MPDDLDARLVVLSAEHPCSRDPDNAAEVAGPGNPGVAGQYAEAVSATPWSSWRWTRCGTRISTRPCAGTWPGCRSSTRRRSSTSTRIRPGRRKTQLKAADDTVTARLPEAYQWLLVPGQERPDAAVSWEAIRLTAAGALAERAGQAAAQRRAAGDRARGDHPAQAPRRGALMARGGSRGGAAACRGFRPVFVPATPTRPGCPDARRPGRCRIADLGVGFIRPCREPRRGPWTLPRFAGGTGGRSLP